MITSISNPQMKHILQLQKKSKARWQQRVFVVEGPKMALEAPKEWVEKVYVSESYFMRAEEALAGYQYEVVSDSVFKAISDTQTPQGILCLVRMPEYTLEDLLTGNVPSRQMEETSEGISWGRREVVSAPHLLILESIQDPGNLGTMLRTGEGAGVSGIIMNRTTVDLFHPKVIRSTMGSLYRVPFYITDHLPETIGKIKRQGVSVYAAHLKGQQSYDEPDYGKGCAFLIGNEGNGLTDEAAGLADTYIRIPMAGQVESLNAAMAAGILMYEVNRQRRHKLDVSHISVKI